MRLNEIISKVDLIKIVGNRDIEINELCLDSRKVKENCLFAAVSGTLSDGHDFIEKAIGSGATAILCSVLPEKIKDEVTYLMSSDVSLTLGQCCDNFFGKPSSKLKLVGITGTNGKTTIASTLYNLFEHFGYKTGLISTVENKIHTRHIDSTHTTPDVISLHSLIKQMVDGGCTYAFMEVSSHAVVQQRIAGVRFIGGVFSNITHDHLDYHKTFANYLKAKQQFFDKLPEESFALYNKDDKNGIIMVQNTKASKYSYALHNNADFRTQVLESDFDGMLLKLDGVEGWFNLVGNFNAYNLLAAYATAFLLDIDKEEIITGLSKMPRVNGRFESIRGPQKRSAIVDYAHTPDALKNVLQTINQIRNRNEQLITVVGCGGNRDLAKRPEMARIAVEMSDRVIFTSDNPRDEEPQDIIDQMYKGVPVEHMKKVLTIVDRREAVKTAVMMCNPGDVILVAGKGHETYQEIKGVKHPFDDHVIIHEFFNMIN